MTRISVYDTDYEVIEKVCEANDMSEAEMIEMLLDYLEDAVSDNGLKRGLE